MTTAESPLILDIHEQFRDVFLMKPGFPPSRFVDHSVPLFPEAKPPRTQAYHYSVASEKEIVALVAELLASGFICPIASSYSSPVLLVKKDGTWRMCIEYQAMNKLTVPALYCISNIDEPLDKLFGAYISLK